MLQLLEVLVEEQLGREAAEQADVAEEPGSDDFHTYAREPQMPTVHAAGQISLDAQIRGARSHPRAFWLTAHQEMRQLTQVAVRVLSALTISASVERTFSVARRVCSDRQMTMTQETVASRVMIQANCVLAIASWARAQVLQSRQKPWEDTAWRLDLPAVQDTQ
jgi:hypothetical protein